MDRFIPPHIRNEHALEARRLHAAKALAAGESQAAIAHRLGVSRQAVHAWWQRYRRAGVAGLRRRPRPGRPPKLAPAALKHLPALLARDADAYGFPTPVWTTQRVAELLRRRFGVRYDRDHVGRLLHHSGFSWQKATGRALERDEAAITRWVQRT